VLRANRRLGKPRIDELVSAVAVYFDTKIEFLTKSAKGRGASNTPRKVAMYVAQQLGDHRLSDIAEYFGLQHYGGVSSAISDLTRRLSNEKPLRKQLKDIIKRLDRLGYDRLGYVYMPSAPVVGRAYCRLDRLRGAALFVSLILSPTSQ
jgi:hypothetical protein